MLDAVGVVAFLGQGIADHSGWLSLALKEWRALSLRKRASSPSVFMTFRTTGACLHDVLLIVGD